MKAGNLVVAVGLSTWHFVSPRTFSIKTLTRASNIWRKERTEGPSARCVPQLPHLLKGASSRAPCNSVLALRARFGVQRVTLSVSPPPSFTTIPKMLCGADK